MDRYSHVGLMDLSDGLARLPTPEDIGQEAESATGTDDAPVLFAPLFAPTSRISMPQYGTEDTSGDGAGALTAHAKTPAGQGFEASPAGEEGERRRPDSNRGWRICNPLP